VKTTSLSKRPQEIFRFTIKTTVQKKEEFLDMILKMTIKTTVQKKEEFLDMILIKFTFIKMTK
jgi:hypothetical protein